VSLSDEGYERVPQLDITVKPVHFAERDFQPRP